MDMAHRFTKQQGQMMSLCYKIRGTATMWVKCQLCRKKISDTKECYEYKAEQRRKSIISVF